MKIMTIAGTRPELVRLSQITPKLDKTCEHTLVFTGQSFSQNMSQIFFEELDIRTPDYNMNIGIDGQSLAKQIAKLYEQTEWCIKHYQPDGLLILGDTNSALSAFIAKRMRVKVYHMEAGNRCYNDISPEEINRRVVDSCSDILMPYTHNSRKNLLKESYPKNKIIVTGNPIFEVLQLHRPSNALRATRTASKQFFLVTLHRFENIEDNDRLISFLGGLRRVVGEYGFPIIFSCHPRTAQRIREMGINLAESNITLSDPLGFMDFVTLEKEAFCVLTDSGTVQEECCILQVPCVTLRDFTERPETVDCGSNMLSGAGPEDILHCVNIMTSLRKPWVPPVEYTMDDVSDRVVGIITGELSSGSTEILVEQADNQRKDKEGQHSGYGVKEILNQSRITAKE